MIKGFAILITAILIIMLMNISGALCFYGIASACKNHSVAKFGCAQNFPEACLVYGRSDYVLNNKYNVPEMKKACDLGLTSACVELADNQHQISTIASLNLRKIACERGQTEQCFYSNFSNGKLSKDLILKCTKDEYKLGRCVDAATKFEKISRHKNAGNIMSPLCLAGSLKACQNWIVYLEERGGEHQWRNKARSFCRELAGIYKGKLSCLQLVEQHLLGQKLQKEKAKAFLILSDHCWANQYDTCYGLDRFLSRTKTSEFNEKMWKHGCAKWQATMGILINNTGKGLIPKRKITTRTRDLPRMCANVVYRRLRR